MSLFDKLFNSGKKLEAQINENGFYAVSDYKVSGKKVKEWSDMLREGVCPPELSVCEFYEWREDIRVSSDIPRRPLNDVYSIEYENKAIARYEDDRWQLYMPSLIDGVPPITAKEIPSIRGKKTITILEKMEELKEEELFFKNSLSETEED
jgi:hypothetical protein